MLTHQWVLDNFDYRADGLYWQKAGGPTRKVGKRAGSIDNKGYRIVSCPTDKGHKTFKEHRLCYFYMTGEWPVNDIDHIDHNPSNNAWSNLRPASRRQNMQNNKGTGITHIKKTDRYIVRITIDGKLKHIGSYSTKDEALKARREAEIKYFGEFAPIRGNQDA